VHRRVPGRLRGPAPAFSSHLRPDLSSIEKDLPSEPRTLHAMSAVHNSFCDQVRAAQLSDPKCIALCRNSTACPSRTRFGRPTDTLTARDCGGGAPILAQEEEKTALPHVEQAHGRSPMCTATPAGHPPGCTAKLTETGRKRSLSVSAWSKTAPRPTEEASAMTKCLALVRKGCKTGADVTAARSKPA
jgi:hypothetical protein